MQLTKKDLAKMLVGIPNDAVLTIHTGYHLDSDAPYWLQFRATYKIVAEFNGSSIDLPEFSQISNKS